jgi:hypothetical protein
METNRKEQSMTTVQHTHGWEAITPNPKRTATEIRLTDLMDQVYVVKDLYIEKRINAGNTGTSESVLEYYQILIDDLQDVENMLSDLVLFERHNKMNRGAND